MTTTSYAPGLPHRIVALLDAGDLHAALNLAADVPNEALRRLSIELGTLSAPRGDVITVGLALLVWGSPWRPNEIAWRCGSCAGTGGAYKNETEALRAARAHRTECDAADRPELCEITPYNSAHSRMTTLTITD